MLLMSSHVTTQSDLDSFSPWVDQQGMKFNISKYANMQVGSGVSNSTVTINNSVITTKAKYNDVGVWFI